MSLIGAIARFILLCLVLAALFFTGMLAFAFIAGLIVVLGIVEWLRRKRVLTSSPFDDSFEVSPDEPPQETVVETKVFEADYTEIDRRG